MRRFLKIAGIGCGGLIALVVVLSIVGALIGGQDTTSQRPSSSSDQDDTSSQPAKENKEKEPETEPAVINLSGSGQIPIPEAAEYHHRIVASHDEKDWDGYLKALQGWSRAACEASYQRSLLS